MQPVHDFPIYVTQLEQQAALAPEHLIFCETFSSNCCHIQRSITAFRPTWLVMSTAGNIRMSLVIRQRNCWCIFLSHGCCTWGMIVFSRSGPYTIDKLELKSTSYTFARIFYRQHSILVFDDCWRNPFGKLLLQCC